MTEVVHGLGPTERQRVAALRAQGRFFWVDVSLSETSRADVIEALGVPDGSVRTLPASGSRTFHADGHAVVFAVRAFVRREPAAGDHAYRFQPLEVQVVITGDSLLTLHDEQLSLPAALAADLPEDRSRRYVVYSVLDAMLASTFDALEEVELTLDALATAGTGGGGHVSRARLREAAARLATLRRWVTAEQAAFERLGVEIRELPDFEGDDGQYFEHLDEEVDRLLASIDAAANGMGMLLDLQLNERAYVVSVVATIFVPLTFLTGYFGMNFGWMVGRIHSPAAFWLLGLVLPLATGVLSWRLLLPRLFAGGAF